MSCASRPFRQRVGSQVVRPPFSSKLMVITSRPAREARSRCRTDFRSARSPGIAAERVFLLAARAVIAKRSGRRRGNPSRRAFSGQPFRADHFIMCSGLLQAFEEQAGRRVVDTGDESTSRSASVSFFAGLAGIPLSPSVAAVLHNRRAGRDFLPEAAIVADPARARRAAPR
jgi:hypothetical protein